MTTKKQNADKLQTVDDKGNVASKRILNATSAWNIFKRCLDEDSNIGAVQRAKVQGLIDGNPPYNPQQLKQLGQSWRSNVNFREAESIRDGNTAAYFSLLFDTPNFISVKVRQPKDLLNDVTEDWGHVIAEEYTDLMMDWPEFLFNFTLHVKEMLTYGLGPVVWPDKFDWRFKAFNTSNILIPPRTKASIGFVRLFFIRDTMSPQDMVEVIENDASAKFGWKIEQMKKVLVDRYSGGRQTDTDKYSKSAWESTQQRIKNNDGNTEDYDDMDDLKIVHGYVQEVKTKKITHFIMPEVESSPEYMLVEENCYDDMGQIFCPFLFDIGDGFMRSVRGIGQRLYAPIELSNRFINTMFDGAMMSSSMIVGSTTSKKDLRLLRNGPITILPEGVQPINQAFAPNLNGIIAARSMLQQIIRNNHGTSGMPVDEAGRPQRTTTEVMIAEGKDARLQNFQIVQYYNHLQKCHVEVMRRLLNKEYPKGHDGYELAMQFRRRCIDRGVPPEVMDFEKLRVRVQRAIGGGNDTIRDAKLQKLLSASAMYDQRGKMNILRDWTASLAGYDGAERYVPLRNRDQINTTEHTLANLENNDLSDGKSVVVGVDQMHPIHLAIHFPPIMEVVQHIGQALQMGRPINPDAVLPYLNAGLQHCNTHVGLMSQDPRQKATVEQYVGAMKMAEHVHKALMALKQKQDAEHQQQMQEQAQTLQDAQRAVQSEDLKVKLAKVQADHIARMTDIANKAKAREYTAQHNAMLKETKLKVQLQLDQATNGGMAQ